MSLGGNDRTQQTTSATSFPSWMTDSQNNLHDRTREYFNGQVKNGGFDVTDLTGNQQMAGQLINGMANGNGGDFSQQILAAGKGYDPSMASASMVGGSEIQSLVNPYLDSVGRDTLDAMGRERANTDAQIGARNASATAFGGSGAALERAQLNRGYGEQVSSTINNLMAQGYDQATSIAMANADRATNVNLANAQAGNTAAQFGAAQGLSAATSAGNSANSAFNNKLGAVGSLLNYGGLEQSQNQAESDRMKSLLSWYSGQIPGVNGTTVQTAPDNSPNFLQQLLGGALTVGGMATGGGSSIAAKALGF